MNEPSHEARCSVFLHRAPLDILLYVIRATTLGISTHLPCKAHGEQALHHAYACISHHICLCQSIDARYATNNAFTETYLRLWDQQVAGSKDKQNNKIDLGLRSHFVLGRVADTSDILLVGHYTPLSQQSSCIFFLLLAWLVST